MTESFIFTKIGKTERKKLLKALETIIDSHDFKAESTTVMSAALSFYPGYRLAEIFDHEIHPMQKRHAVISDDYKDMSMITYSADTIDALNSRIPVKLNDHNVADYMRFYFEMVMGPYGKFQIVEMIDDVPWTDDLAPQDRKAFSRMIQDARLMDKDAQGNFILSATLLFKAALFETQIKISPQGAVEIISQDMVKDDLSVKDQLVG